MNECVRQRRVALTPVDAIEQHGSHLPVDVDNTFVGHICNEVARRAPDAAVALPEIHCGCNAHNMDCSGTIGIMMQHFVDYCCNVSRATTARLIGICCEFHDPPDSERRDRRVAQ